MSVIMNKVNAMADSAEKVSHDAEAKENEMKPITDDELAKQSESTIKDLADSVDKHKAAMELAAHKDMIEEKVIEKKADEEEIQEQLRMTAMKKANLLKEEQDEKTNSLVQKTAPAMKTMYGELDDDTVLMLEEEHISQHDFVQSLVDVKLDNGGIADDEDTYMGEPTTEPTNGLTEVEQEQKSETITEAVENNAVHEGEHSAPIEPVGLASKPITIEEKLAGTDKPVADVNAVVNPEASRTEPSAQEIA